MNINKMNVLYFTRTMNLGGTENVILQLCEIMKPNVNKIVVCSCGGVNVEKLTEMGIKHYKIPDIEQKNPETMLVTFYSVLKILKNERINVVHTHHRMAAFYSRVLLFFTKFIFMNTSHNTFQDKKALTYFVYKKAYLIAVGNKVKENLCEFYELPYKQVTVIPNAIKPFEGKLEDIEILTKFRNEGYFLVGNIGRLSKQKGMEYYIEAIPNILEKYPKVQFFIAGDGDDKEKLTKLVSDMNLEDNLIFLGYRDDIQNVMSQLDLVVLSSLWEGLPLTPIEAFSMGKTIVATAVDGTVEIIDDGVNGLLVDAKDSKALAQKIISLCNGSINKEILENNAYDTFKLRFSYDRLKKDYTNYYRSIL